MKNKTKQIFYLFFFSLEQILTRMKVQDTSTHSIICYLSLFKIPCILCSRNRSKKTQCKQRCNSLINAASTQTDVSFNSNTSQKLHSLLDSLDDLKNTLRHCAPRKKCLYLQIFCFERGKIRTIEIPNMCTFTQ